MRRGARSARGHPAPTPSVPPRRRRDRRGRGLRGPLAPPQVPVARSRAERFDEAVLDALERLERRWATELGGVQLLVEDVPPAPGGPGSDRHGSSPDGMGDPTGEVPLGRVDPAGRRRPARLVVYRRPVEARAMDDRELAELTRRVLTGLVADLLGLTPDDVDPDAPTDP